MINKFNNFHIISPRPWPLLASFQAQSMIIGTIIIIIKKNRKNATTINIILMMLIPISWWKNTITESRIEGAHQNQTCKGLKIGIILFIASEVIFFSRFFWGYFHAGTSPNIELGVNWPPPSVKTFNPVNTPLLNTIILVSSGFSVTFAHHLILEKKLFKSIKILAITCGLGLYFSILQKIEYDQAEFSMRDSTYGRIFFIATGFHGIHVLIGTAFLIVSYGNIKKMVISYNHHVGFELAAWYWHFVDVIWLFLYLSIYWWGV